MAKPKLDEITMKVFKEKMNAAYKRWADAGDPETGKRRTQTDFAKLVHTTQPTVSQWLLGKTYPSSDALEQICEVLGVPKDYFDLNSLGQEYLELYKTPEWSSWTVENQIKRYCELLGLDLNFLRAVVGLTDFDNLFPLWTPLVAERHADGFVGFKRMSPFNQYQLPEAGEVDDKYLQVLLPGKPGINNGEPKRVFLQRADLVFLRDLQDEFVFFIESMFRKRDAEMDKELREASRAALIQTDPSKHEWGYASVHLSEEQLKAIDSGAKAPTLGDLEKKVLEKREKDLFIDTDHGALKSIFQPGISIELSEESYKLRGYESKEAWEEAWKKAGGGPHPKKE